MKITYKTKLELLDLLYTKKMLGINHINYREVVEQKSKINKLPNDLNSLHEYASNCSLCELSKGKISLSFSKGSIKSKIFLISTYLPIEDEKKFQKIKNMVEHTLKININDIYITNILKCNVKKIKIDIENEIKKCIPYLEQQIKLLEPIMIITLGTAFTYLMKNKNNIVDISGNEFIYNNIKVVPLLDLDFINQNPSYKEKMNIDLEKIKNILDEK